MSTTIQELEAMRAIADALEPLEDEAKVRVLRWVGDHFKVTPQAGTIRAPISGAALAATIKVNSDGYETIGDLFAAASPSSDAEKALVVGYWLQQNQGQVGGFAAQDINNELKHLGYGIGNITRAFEALKKTKPQQVIQLRKAGSTKQARKTFKLTAAGIAAVEAMISNSSLD